MNTSKSLDLHKILSETIQVYKLQAGESKEGKVWFNVMNEPFALSFDYTAAAIVEAVEGLAPKKKEWKSEPQQMSNGQMGVLDATPEIWKAYNQAVADFLQAIKEWQ